MSWQRKMTMCKVFLDQDNDCHWYIIPVRMRDEWEAWKELEWDHPDADQVPVGVEMTSGGIDHIEFEYDL